MTAAKEQTPSRPMFRLFRYLGNYKQSLWFSILSSLIYKCFDIMPPFLTAWMIDTVSGKTPDWILQITGLTDLPQIVLALAFLTLFIFGFESIFEWLSKLGFMRLAQKVQHDLRLDTYNHLQHREVAYFEEQRTGNLMAMLNNDINQLERFLNNSFNEIIQLAALILLAGWSLLSVSLPLGIISLLPIPFIMLGSLFYQKKVGPRYRKVREAVGALSTRLENNISGMMVIKSFTAENYESGRVEKSSADYRDANFSAIKLSAAYIPLIRMIIAVDFALVLFLGSTWVLQDNGALTLGGLAFFAMMTQRLHWPITRLGSVFDEFERARASARRVFGLLDSIPAIQDAEQAITLQDTKGALLLKGVSFYYKKELPILENINLDIRPGQTLGIAGPTGTGKSTLIKLLLRLYDVTNGQILLDGIDIRNISQKSLRQNIALVSQDVYLFHGTIRENIAYGKMNAADQQIVAVAQKAKLHDFIMSLPQGYDTIVGERGIKLSGGQRQRLSISRALLKDAPVLILDEATSSVDTETEKAIQQNINQLTTNKTALIIAHRLSTISNANHIVVLKEGKIIEAGTHSSLIELRGIYHDLWNIQVGQV